MGFLRYTAKILSPELLSGKGSVYRQQWVNPTAPGNTNVHAAVTCPSSGTTVVTTAITNPDVPRTVRIKGNQATVTGNVVVAGTNQYGAAITDTIASNGTSAVDGVKAFKTITSITIPTRGAASDSISVGFGPGLGLDRKLAVGDSAGLVGGCVDSTREATMPTLDEANHTVTFNTALANTKTYTVVFIHEDFTTA